MAEALTTEPIPLVSGPDGVMRVRGTRVTLETVLAAFAEGATAEEIAQRYPSIPLADVYQVIGYGFGIRPNWIPIWRGGAGTLTRPEDRMSPGGRRTVSPID
jgi:hypothetical protein